MTRIQSKRLCALSEIQPDAGRETRVDGPGGHRDIALFLYDGEVLAYLNACPHQGRNLTFAPDEFLIGGNGRLVCPHHGACFNLATGECVDGPCKGASLTKVDVIVSEGSVYLK